jgi:hypothetical protein
VIDVSFTGADVKIAGRRPAIGSLITVGRVRGRVVRHTEAGVAVEFVEPVPGGTLTERLAALR